MKTLIVCAALVAIAVPAAAAGIHPARQDPEVLQTTVSYADLDLNRPAGADVMIARVRRAAQAVCGQGLFADLNRTKHTRDCVAAAMDAAFAQVDAPLVTTRFAHKPPAAELAAR